MKTIGTLALAAGVLLLWPSPAQAQQPPDAADLARFHLGPLSFTPKLSIQNIGVDTNVFNSDTQPFKDFTIAASPGVDAWLRLNRVLVTSKTTSDVAYFQKAQSQRSLNITEEWRIDISTLRATPRLAGLYLRSRQRPNDEIDERVQQKLVGGGVGVTVPVGSRLRIDADAKRTRFDYSQGIHGDAEIAEALNRDSDHVSVMGRFEVTELTSIAVRAETIRDRFTFSTDRDSDSIRVMPGVLFQPSALFSGSAFVGVRQFKTLNAAVPDYTGMVAAIELKYVALDMFRVTTQIKRDVDYSLDLTEPFFVSTSVGVEVMQMLGLNWDVVGRARQGNLNYQQVTPGVPGRVDHVRVLGTGIGRRLGDDLRVGFDVDYVKRTSLVASRAYEGMRFGGSLTYGY